MAGCESGTCEHCNHEFTPGEEFSVFDTVLNKRIKVECVENDKAELVFKVLESGHPQFGQTQRIRKSWLN